MPHLSAAYEAPFWHSELSKDSRVFKDANCPRGKLCSSDPYSDPYGKISGWTKTHQMDFEILRFAVNRTKSCE